jgi:hypothetical protein
MHALDRLYARIDGPIAPTLIRAARVGPARAAAETHAGEAGALGAMLTRALAARARRDGHAGITEDEARALRTDALAHWSAARARQASCLTA